MGGVAYVGSKEFHEAHEKYIDQLAKANEPTSAPPGTRADKRTVALTCSQLEDQGRLKTRRTMLSGSLGSNKIAIIAYLLDTPEEVVVDFMKALTNTSQQSYVPGAPIRRIEERIEYGSTRYTSSRSKKQPFTNTPLNNANNVVTDSVHDSGKGSEPESGWSRDEMMLKDSLLQEKSTVSQHYGFTMAKGFRCRDLHSEVVQCFVDGTSPYVVSSSDRILDISYLYYDLPLRRYLRLVSPLHYSEELNQFLSTSEGPQTLVKELPKSIKSILSIGKSRPRQRILDMFKVIQALNLAQPLRPVESPGPMSITPTGSHPANFEIFPSDEWTPENSLVAPTYWKFSDAGPVHAWVLSESDPPFLKDMPLTTSEEVRLYWNSLKYASTGTIERDQDSQNAESVTGSVAGRSKVGKSLRRAKSWNTSYMFTYHQKEYLRKYVDFTTGRTPLQDGEAGEETTRKISAVVSASLDAVREYYGWIRGRALRDISRMQAKETPEQAAAKDAAHKESLLHKAAEARRQKEKDWEELKARIAPGELSPEASIRIQRIRKKYMDSAVGPKTEKWEKQIATALKEAESATRRILKTKRPSQLLRPQAAGQERVPLPVAPNPSEKSVADLMAMQGPARERPPKVKRKEKQKDGES
jgi:oxalate---CoA ligase